MATGMVPAAQAPASYVDMFYFGTQMTHHLAAYTSNMAADLAKGYGRVRIRREGFVSLAPEAFEVDAPAVARTHALPSPGPCPAGQTPQLRVNADVSVAGQLNATLIHPEKGTPLPAYAGARVLPIVANGVRIPVQVGRRGRFPGANTLAFSLILLPPSPPLSSTLIITPSQSCSQALTKFLRCVDWDDPREASEAAELIAEWAPIDIADSLELLSSGTHCLRWARGRGGSTLC